MTGPPDQLIRTITVKGLTEDGVRAEITTIRITQTEDGFEVDYLLNGNVVDGQTCDTRTEAERQGREWAIEAHRDYQEEERERKAEDRRKTRELLNGAAKEFAGDDARALRMIGAIIAQGRSKAAVEALRALNQPRRRDA